MKKLLIFGLLLLIPVLLTACTPKNTTPDSELESVAQWITQSGAKMYGAWWCPHCQDQKKKFGEAAFKRIDYIECAKPDRSQTSVCQSAKIESYPTWEFGDGTRITRVMTIEELKEKTGYTETPIAGPEPAPATP